MKRIRGGIGVLALAFAIGTAGGCAEGRVHPRSHPSASRGEAPAKVKAKKGDRRQGDRGLHRGHDKEKKDRAGKNGKRRGNGKP